MYSAVELFRKFGKWVQAVVFVLVIAGENVATAEGLPGDPLVYRGVVASGSVAQNTPMRVTLWQRWWSGRIPCSKASL